jgi:hypothetical protein
LHTTWSFYQQIRLLYNEDFNKLKKLKTLFQVSGNFGFNSLVSLRKMSIFTKMNYLQHNAECQNFHFDYLDGSALVILSFTTIRRRRRRRRWTNLGYHRRWTNHGCHHHSRLRHIRRRRLRVLHLRNLRL